MKRFRIILSTILLLSSFYVFGQSKAETEFTAFAKKQNDLFVDAYKKRDARLYNALLTDFLERYERLAKEERQLYMPFYRNTYYNLSCLYSLNNNKDLALLHLDKAIKAGYSNYGQIMKDTDFDNIRSEKEFARIVQPTRELGDYLYILKKDNRFSNSDSIALPAFTYQSPENADLVRLRKQLSLDSIAGTGNDASRLINVLRWVHNTVPHDGQTESGIKSINGMEIFAVSQSKNIGVSCGELATLLNDCYLALGFKSRKVYCLPKDSLKVDYDSHVINSVYSTQLKKWLWMDPTHGAYVMNEKGELLGIDEVRSRLIDQQPLILNPDANWNRRTSTLKDHYLDYYMAKNLYRFYTTLESGFDIETRGQEKTVTYVNLVPLGYGKFANTPSKMEFYNKELKTRFVHYTTRNPFYFWETPGQ